MLATRSMPPVSQSLMMKNMFLLEGWAKSQKDFSEIVKT
jgi:hypothetical protein